MSEKGDERTRARAGQNTRYMGAIKLRRANGLQYENWPVWFNKELTLDSSFR